MSRRAMFFKNQGVPGILVLKTNSTSSSFGLFHPSTTESSSSYDLQITGDASGSYSEGMLKSFIIDLSGNTGIAIITITSSNNFQDVSHPQLQIGGFTYFEFILPEDNTSITGLTISSTLNNITYFDAHQLSSLSTLTFIQQDITSFDVSQYPNLTYLNLSSNASVSTINITAVTELATFIYSGMGLNSLSLTGMSNLVTLTGGNQAGAAKITALNLVDCSSLVNVTYTLGQELETVSNLTNNPSLLNVNFSTCKLQSGEVNHMLLELDANGLSNGTFNYSGGSTVPPTAGGGVLTAYNNLISKGWTITGAVPA